MSGHTRIRGWAFCALCLSLPTWSAASMGGPDTALSVHNGREPAGGRETWRLVERWRLDPDSDAGAMLGRVQQVIAGEDGTIYLLDQQLAKVHLFSPDGRYLRSLSREGDGPGESRNPADLVFLPSGGLGLVQSYPARIIGISLTGDPLGAIEVRPAQAVKGTDRFLRRVKSRGGTLSYSGQTIAAGGGTRRTRKMLAVCDEQGRERACIHATETEDVMSTRRWVEKEEYFVHDCWDLGPDGMVFLAPEYGAYVIQAFRPDGTLALTITRDFEPRRRSAEEKVGLGVKISAGGRELEIDNVIEDHAPCIQSLHVASDGMLWVRDAWGRVSQPAGVFETWDLFDAQGRYQRQVSLAVDAHPDEDQLFRIGQRRFVLIRGFEERVRIQIGGGDGEGVDDGTPSFELICYEVEG